MILLWSFWNFLNEGHGTPAPIDPPKELVAAGFYRYVRNPMYVAILAIVIGHFLWFGYWNLLIYAIVVFVALIPSWLIMKNQRSKENLAHRMKII